MPQKLQRIDLTVYQVPREATALMFTWTLDPPDAKAWLYRTRYDAEPMLLAGPAKIKKIGLVDRQTLYFRIESESERFVRFDLDIQGYETIAES